MPEGVTIVIGSVMMIRGLAGSMGDILHPGMRCADWGIRAVNGGVRGVRLIMENSVIDPLVLE